MGWTSVCRPGLQLCPDLEECEKSLNDLTIGLNNLDLDENAEVDFVRVGEEIEGTMHLSYWTGRISTMPFQRTFKKPAFLDE